MSSDATEQRLTLNSLERYDYATYVGFEGVDKDPDGEYVKFADVARLLAQRSETRLPASFAVLADVHRGWCNYCKGVVEVCRKAPEGGCSLRDVEREAAGEVAEPSAMKLEHRRRVAVSATRPATNNDWHEAMAEIANLRRDLEAKRSAMQSTERVALTWCIAQLWHDGHFFEDPISARIEEWLKKESPKLPEDITIKQVLEGVIK